MSNFAKKLFKKFGRKQNPQEKKISSPDEEIKLVDVLSEQSPFAESYAEENADDSADTTPESEEDPSLPIPNDTNESFEQSSQEHPLDDDDELPTSLSDQQEEALDISDLDNEIPNLEEAGIDSEQQDTSDEHVDFPDRDMMPSSQDESTPEKKTPLSFIGKAISKASQLFSRNNQTKEDIDEEPPHLKDPFSDSEGSVEQSIPNDGNTSVTDQVIPISEPIESKDADDQYKSDDHKFIEQIYQKNDSVISDSMKTEIDEASTSEPIVDNVGTEKAADVPCEKTRKKPKKKLGMPLINSTINKLHNLVNTKKSPEEVFENEKPRHQIDPLEENKTDLLNKELEPLEHTEEQPDNEIITDDISAATESPSLDSNKGDDIDDIMDAAADTLPVIEADSSSLEDIPGTPEEEPAAIDEPPIIIEDNTGSPDAFSNPVDNNKSDNEDTEVDEPVDQKPVKKQVISESPAVAGQENENQAVQSDHEEAQRDESDISSANNGVELKDTDAESIIEDETVSFDLQEKMALENQGEKKSSKNKKAKKSLPDEDKDAFSLDCIQYLSFGNYFFVIARKKLPKMEKKMTDIEIKKKTPLKQFKDSIPNEIKVNNRVFVIAGSKKEMNNACMEVLSKLGLEPILAHDQFNFSESTDRRYIQYPDVKFAIVILSGDDFVYPKNGKPADSWLRSRQDIVFELGNLIGKFGRQNVFSLYYEQKSFLLPTSLHNATYTPFDNAGHWKYELLQHLRLAGFEINKDTKF